MGSVGIVSEPKTIQGVRWGANKYQGFREEATMLQEQESGPSVIAASMQ